jgi:AraC family transcriptional regulator
MLVTPNMQSAVANGISQVQPLVRMTSTENFRLSERFYPSNTLSPMHAHRNNYIIITLDGQYVSTFGNRTEAYRPWTVTYHRAGVSHTSRYSNAGAKVLYVEIPTERITSFGHEDTYHVTTISAHGGLVEWSARHLYNEFKNPDYFSAHVLDSFVVQLFAQLCRRSGQLPSSLPAWLGHADELIGARFKEPLSLETLASAVHVHPVHLAREFRRHYRCTVGQQIRRLRIEYACEQLATTSRSLSDVALAAGFADQSHFTVTFKKQIGTTPSRFRSATKTAVYTTQAC